MMLAMAIALVVVTVVALVKCQVVTRVLGYEGGAIREQERGERVGGWSNRGGL